MIRYVVGCAFLLVVSACASSAPKTVEERFEEMRLRAKRQCEKGGAADYSRAYRPPPPYVSEDGNPLPICRVQPWYPSKCQSPAAKLETVTLGFDVTPNGRPVNIRLVEATHECFVTNSASALALSSFEETEAGYRGATTNFTFKLVK